MEGALSKDGRRDQWSRWFACSGSETERPPAGSCKTGGTATGSYEAACNQCALEHCNAAKKLKE
jgi:hypothetical protein